MAGKFLRYVFFVVLGIYGYRWGTWTAPAMEQAQFSSEEKPAPLDDFAKLPCPSEAEFLRLAGEVNLVIPEGASLDAVCDQSPRALLAKSLLLMTSLKINPPGSWPEPLRSDMRSPFEFLKKNTNKLALDLNQKDSIAYNKIAVREIYLGGRFFTANPLNAIGILVHEARHSVKEAPGHELCLSGDIPRSSGACDAEFSLEDSKSGAYSYGTLFLLSLSLYSEGLAESDRQSTMTDALVQLGARFNQIPDAFARKVDVLAVLGADHRIYLVHPFLRYAKPLALPFGTGDERPERIEFAPLHNGLLIYTNKGQVWHWSSRRGLLRLYEDLLKSDMAVADVARLRVPFLDDTAYALRLRDGTMKVIEYSPQLNSRIIKDYPVSTPRTNGPTPDIRRMLLALYNDSVFLDRAGSLFIAPHFGNEYAFTKQPELQSPKGWQAASGGIIYDSLFLIDRDGALFSGSMTLEDIPSESDSEILRKYGLKPSELRLPAPLKKFSQGLKIQGALSDQGRMFIWKYGLDEARPLDLGFPAIDFVLMQNAETQDPVGRTTRDPEKFKQVCDVKRSLRDPWMGAGIGVDRDDKIVMAGARDGECLRREEREFRAKTPYFD